MKTAENLLNIREVEIKYTPDRRILNQQKVLSSKSAFEKLIQGYNMDTIAMQEQFVVLYLNRANIPIGIYKTSIGGVSATYVDSKLIFATALKCLASSIILSHNHPSCQLYPSSQDLELTTKLRDGAKLLDITVLDHLIISPFDEQFYSFADNGMM